MLEDIQRLIATLTDILDDGKIDFYGKLDTDARKLHEARVQALCFAASFKVDDDLAEHLIQYPEDILAAAYVAQERDEKPIAASY